MASTLYIGLISGTSMDAIDCALVDISGGKAQQVDFINTDIPADIKADLLNLCEDHHGQIPLLGKTDVAFARLLAGAVNHILALNKLTPGDIAAIGSHGQTIRHQPPGSPGQTAYTLQIGDPNVLAELTGITTVADFRRRDMAAGGHGAPIVPAFHREIFSSPDQDRIVLNIGGMANITLLGKTGKAVTGCDTGPGNVLMDYWMQRQCNRPYDRNGEWAASGEVNAALLGLMLADEYFDLPAPKSTGRELFNGAWLHNALQELGHDLEAVDIQATLLALTVTTIANAIRANCTQGEVIVCGGGANNRRLMHELIQALDDFRVMPSSTLGVMEDSVEAVAFAWFASKTLAREPVDFTGITGSSHPVIAGGIYYAG